MEINFFTIDKFTEGAMVFASLIALIGTHLYIFEYHNHRWLCYMQLIAMLGILIIYLLLLCDIEPLTSNLNVRSQVIRIVLFFLFTSFGLDRMNGRIARWLDKLSPR